MTSRSRVPHPADLNGDQAAGSQWHFTFTSVAARTPTGRPVECRTSSAWPWAHSPIRIFRRRLNRCRRRINTIGSAFLIAWSNSITRRQAPFRRNDRRRYDVVSRPRPFGNSAFFSRINALSPKSRNPRKSPKSRRPPVVAPLPCTRSCRRLSDKYQGGYVLNLSAFVVTAVAGLFATSGAMAAAVGGVTY